MSLIDRLKGFFSSASSRDADAEVADNGVMTDIEPSSPLSAQMLLTPGMLVHAAPGAQFYTMHPSIEAKCTTFSVHDPSVTMVLSSPAQDEMYARVLVVGLVADHTNVIMKPRSQGITNPNGNIGTWNALLYGNPHPVERVAYVLWMDIDPFMA